MPSHLSIFSKILEEIIFDVYLISDNKKKVIYITSKSAGLYQYYLERIFNKNELKIDKLRSIYIWEIRRFINEQYQVLIDMHQSFIRFFNDGIFVPYHITEFLNIDMPIDLLIRHKNQKLKKVHSFGYDIKNDIDSLRFFYEKMHIPYAKKKYRNDANIDNFEKFEKILKKGELILIKFDGEYIAGTLNEIKSPIYHIKKFGVIDESFVKKGALVAAYYFSILMAKEKNCKTADFGGSKPFLLDGVLRHKILWGTKICIDKSNKRVIYLKNVSFEQPFIYIKDNKLKSDISPEYRALIKQYERSGLEITLKEE